jgi:hypothetical protein
MPKLRRLSVLELFRFLALGFRRRETLSAADRREFAALLRRLLASYRPVSPPNPTSTLPPPPEGGEG